MRSTRLTLWFPVILLLALISGCDRDPAPTATPTPSPATAAPTFT